ncbi:MAG: PaaI family thioesterase [Magnetospirillum sp.]|nr:PaaI family thioesterase [Magnetospirillum sp.]
MAAISVEEFNADFLPKVPMAANIGIRATALAKNEARLLMPFSDALARPVNTVSGPALMTLADVAAWAVVLTVIGRQEMAVTTSLTMNFLRMPGSADIVAEAKILKMGRRLAVSAIELIRVDTDDLVAHATATYAIP